MSRVYTPVKCSLLAISSTAALSVSYNIYVLTESSLRQVFIFLLSELKFVAVR
jgi:hypothetical protein